LIISQEVSCPNGILFLCEDNGCEIIPSDTSAASVTTTENCIAFWTRPEVDGTVKLQVIENDSQTNLTKIITHQLNLQGNIVSVSQPDGEIIFSVNTECTKPIATVYRDELMSQIDILFEYE